MIFGKNIFSCMIRHYLLDLMRVTPRDANYKGPGSRFCILRPELITAFCQVINCYTWFSLFSSCFVLLLMSFCFSRRSRELQKNL